jgi:hypothetical protein
VKNITEAQTMERQRGNNSENSSEILQRLAKRWQQNMSLLNGDLISKVLEKTVSTLPLAPSVMFYIASLAARVGNKEMAILRDEQIKRSTPHYCQGIS